MGTFEVAHFREQGIDIICVVVASSYATLPNKEQNAIAARLELAANDAGLRGTVVPVWDAGFGRLAFLAPPKWHSFFRSLTLDDIAVNINYKLTVT